MPLKNSQLRYYDSNVLRLPADKRKEYHAQVDYLVSELSFALKDKSKIKITKVVKAGSFAKFTILRKTTEDPVDVDLVFYISGKSVDKETRESLMQLIYDLLIEVYPNKKVKQFEIQRKAATVEFVGSGLSVDIVPVIEIANRPNFGWQYGTDGSKTLTCAPCQIDFVRKRKSQDEDFRTLVRMTKRWRRHKELSAISGFTAELLVAHALQVDGTGFSIEERFQRILAYIARSGLKEVISFEENSKPLGTFTDPVVILDPVNGNNNVAARITEAERREIVAAAMESYELSHLASVDDDIDMWKQVFGPRFKVED
jgi:tRNA nucleotidyltransferase (CCA-adding enzyme)